MDISGDMSQPYFKSQERRTEQLTARIPKRIKDDLLRLARFWAAKEREATGDATVEVTIGDVVVRLLDVGLEGAWEEAREGLDEKTIDRMIRESEKSSKSSN